jgi:hypothetical protein
VRTAVAVGGGGELLGDLRAPVGRRAGDRGGHLRFTDRGQVLLDLCGLGEERFVVGR